MRFRDNRFRRNTYGASIRHVSLRTSSPSAMNRILIFSYFRVTYNSWTTLKRIFAAIDTFISQSVCSGSIAQRTLELEKEYVCNLNPFPAEESQIVTARILTFPRSNSPDHFKCFFHHKAVVLNIRLILLLPLKLERSKYAPKRSLWFLNVLRIGHILLVFGEVWGNTSAVDAVMNVHCGQLVEC